MSLNDLTPLLDFETYEGKCFRCAHGIPGLGVFCTKSCLLLKREDSCEEFEERVE